MDTNEKWISVYFPHRGEGIHLPTDCKRKMDQLLKGKWGGAKKYALFSFSKPQLDNMFFLTSSGMVISITQG